MPEHRLSIGYLAKETRTKVETIRYYEHIGLIPTPPRTGGNYRSYQREHLDRLRFIRRARDLGFSLFKVRGLLSLSEQRSCSCEGVDGIAREHLAEVERKIADLDRLRSELEDIINRCTQRTVGECRIIGALSPTAPV